ncbi:MAG TPA: hypothetical protein VLH58_05030 [Candidatus Methylomirabilis sp.]|nr:hypothetical protein [Candidatus Methylomirabilis sp.]HSC70693.1 hypothetical protein [Candidatus Methylomirabilis sp.]
MATRLTLFLLVLIPCWGGFAVASDRPPQATSAEALKLARDSVGRLDLKRLSVRERGHGHVRVRAEILFNGQVVTRLRVNPETGGFLAEEEHFESSGAPLDPPALRAAVERSLRQLEVGDWTWPTEHGRAWGVTLKHRGRVVGTLKVDPKRGLLPRDNDED